VRGLPLKIGSLWGEDYIYTQNSFLELKTLIPKEKLILELNLNQDWKYKQGDPLLVTDGLAEFKKLLVQVPRLQANRPSF